MEHLVGSVTDFSDTNRVIVTVNDERIVVLAHAGDFYALSAVCAHMGGPVGEGLVLGRVAGVTDQDGRYLRDDFVDDEPHLVCPWHGWEYDLRTGASQGLPSVGLKTYQVDVRDDRVYVHV